MQFQNKALVQCFDCNQLFREQGYDIMSSFFVFLCLPNRSLFDFQGWLQTANLPGWLCTESEGRGRNAKKSDKLAMAERELEPAEALWDRGWVGGH